MTGVVIDSGDHACVHLLLELRAGTSGLPGRSLIHLIASDPAAPIVLPAWCHLTAMPTSALFPPHQVGKRHARRLHPGVHRPGFSLTPPHLTSRTPAQTVV